MCGEMELPVMRLVRQEHDVCRYLVIQPYLSCNHVLVYLRPPEVRWLHTRSCLLVQQHKAWHCYGLRDQLSVLA